MNPMKSFCTSSVLFVLLGTNAYRVPVSKPAFRHVSMTSAVFRDSVSSPAPANTIPGVTYSPLQGKALENNPVPTLAEVKAAIPKECFVRNTPLSLAYAAMDLVFTSICAFVGYKYILPLGFKPITLLAWIPYAIATGTAAIGMWVTAHECGHGAFSNNKRLQDFVGYLYHTFLLVPYFSWQRSHAVHHANTNHIVDGETHVPVVAPTSIKSTLRKVVGKTVGDFVWGSAQIFLHLFFGWPAYLLTGKTGGYSRGVTNHFIPFPLTKPPNPAKELFAGTTNKIKVLMSDVGIIGAVAALVTAVKTFGFAPVMALYGGPYLIVNLWLVLYTWLHHTQTDIPHLAAEDFTFIKGAFLTVDRPYKRMLGGLVDFLHHGIGSTHGKIRHSY